MLRHVLNENIKNLNDTDAYVLEYLTKVPFDWFIDQMATDKDVRKTLYKAFAPYFGYESMMHPYYKVWKKISKGVNMDELIVQTDLYGHDYKMLAEQINELFMDKYRPTIYIILKAFAERDFEELANKYCFIENFTCKDVIDNIKDYAEMVATNLDEEDLESIILFCGKQPDNRID